MPSLPTATYMTQQVLLNLPWSTPDGYRSHTTTNLALPHKCRQHTNGTPQRACRWKRTFRITTRLHTMSCHTHTCPRPEPLQKHEKRETTKSKRYGQTRVAFHRRFRTAHMHHAHPQIQPSNPDVAIAKHGGFAMHTVNG